MRDNQWNHARGIVHFIMRINGMSPLIKAEQDTPIRGAVADNYDAMPLAFANGTPLYTSADARFSLDIGVLSRQGLSVTVREPVGLYMIDWDDTGWEKPDGTPVGDYWRVVRGRPDAALRLEYEVPKAAGFVVGDIRIGGRPIRYGGQLAEHVTVMAGGARGTARVRPDVAALLLEPRRRPSRCCRAACSCRRWRARRSARRASPRSRSTSARSATTSRATSIPGFNKDHQHFLFLAIADVAGARGAGCAASRRSWRRWTTCSPSCARTARSGCGPGVASRG